MPVRVTVVLIDLATLTPDAVAPWLAGLDAEERRRADRFAVARARIAFIAAHALARGEIARALGVAPAAVRFVAGAHGKPFAVLAGEAVAVSFSLSHGGGMAGVALAAQGDLPLGLDLEARGRRISPEIARRYFAPAEIAALEALPGAGRAEALVRLWTLKEAFVKATGRGLGGGLDGFAFSRWVARGRAPGLAFAEAGEDVPEAWRFARHRDGAVLASLAARTGGEALDVRWRKRLRP